MTPRARRGSTRVARAPENRPAGLPMAPPGGTRDLLPPVSMTRTVLWQGLIDTFDMYGYQRVTTPPFEYADVIERGLQTKDGRDLVRFVEPDTGEVALLRPDITPQVARIIATRLQDRPSPWRLCYEGTVVRRRRGRARRQQQVLQCGIECVGLKAPDADAEVIEVAIQACERVGLREFLVELAQVRIGAEVLDHVPDNARGAVVEALASKDSELLEVLLREAGVITQERNRLRALCNLYGDRSVLREARKRLHNEAAKRALDDLERVVDRLEEHGLGDRVGIDLSDLRRQQYYTGVSMTLLAHGPGEPLGVGGRYDHLLERFGSAAPATGFAFDVDNVLWALAAAGVVPSETLPLRAVVAGGAVARRRKEAGLWRDLGVRVSVLPAKKVDAAKRYAKAWSCDLVVWLERAGARVTRVSDGRTRRWTGPPDATLLSWGREGSPS